MKIFFSYLTRKLCRYRRVVLKIVVLTSLLIPLVFLYKYFLQPLNEISAVQSLKSSADFIPIDTQKINEVALKLNKKTTDSSSQFINNLKSPFDPVAEEEVLEEVPIEAEEVSEEE